MKRYMVFALWLLCATAVVFAGGGREQTETDQSEPVPTGSEQVIEDNKMVGILYEGTLEDGSIFDSSDNEPLEFLFGVGMIIPGLEQGIRGLTVGDTADVAIRAEDAYGPYYDEAVQAIPREEFSPDLDLQEGMQLVGQTPQGPLLVTILEVGSEQVTVDFNHPLAGKDLYFAVEVVSVRDATDEDIEMIFGPGMFEQ